MNEVFSNSETLYFYTNGDNITADMGVDIPAGFGLVQYLDTQTGAVVTDFAKLNADGHPARLFPQPYSSKEGAILQPDAGGRWCLDDPQNTLEFDSSGACLTEGYQNVFRLGSKSVNYQTFPALELIGNLASPGAIYSRTIYYKGKAGNRSFMCQKSIPVQAAAGAGYDIIHSIEGRHGPGDGVLSADDDYAVNSMFLAQAGEKVDPGSAATYKFYKMVAGSWTPLSTSEGKWEIGSSDSRNVNNVLTVYRDGVDGTDMFKVEILLNGVTYTRQWQHTDVRDPYFLDLGRSTPSTQIGEGEAVTYSPKMYVRETKAIDSGHSWQFTMTFKCNLPGSTLADITKTFLSTDSAPSATVSSAQMEEYRQILVSCVARRIS